MALLIDEFHQLFSQLERMSSKAISEALKAPFLLVRMRHDSDLGVTNVTFQIRHMKDLS